MLEKIHYILAALCGLAMIGVVFGCGPDGLPWAAAIAGVYLVTKALLIGKK